MHKEKLTTEQVKEMLLLVAERIIAAEPLLTDADRNLGDGDHGLGMQRGLTAVTEKLTGTEFPSIDKVFGATGMAMISSMGGASGAIFGTVFRAGGKAVAGAESFGSPELATFLQAAVEGVMQRGGAKPGDKTMIDSLHPAAEKAAELTGQPLVDSMAAVAEAAAAGRDASCDLIATMGRAKTLGERSIGHPDAGACSVAIILEAMHEYVAS